MITENYLQIMIDSLLKKIEILKKVSELNEQQSALLDDKEFDGDKLQSNICLLYTSPSPRDCS